MLFFSKPHVYESTYKYFSKLGYNAGKFVISQFFKE